MKFKHHWLRLDIIKLSVAIGLGVILTACNSPLTSSVTPINTMLPPIDTVSSATLPPAATTASVSTTNAPKVGVAPSPTFDATDVPPCKSPVALTPAQTEGPYYKPNSPERASLIESGMSGTKLIVTGYVFTPDCRPVAKAWLDFWQADDKGVYDNAGYRLRGHLFTDENGRYSLETIVPGEYPGRTEHIHVKVQPPNGSILTTQLYFPGVAANDQDSIFNSALLANVQDTAEGQVAKFDFIVNEP